MVSVVKRVGEAQRVVWIRVVFFVFLPLGDAFRVSAARSTGNGEAMPGGLDGGVCVSVWNEMRGECWSPGQSANGQPPSGR